MGKEEGTYKKRTQADYPMSLKLAIVQEYEQGEMNVRALTRKYGIQGDNTVRNWIDKFGSKERDPLTLRPFTKTEGQEILELREKINVLERKNERLEKELEKKDMKAEFFNLMLQIAQKEFNLEIKEKTTNKA